MAKEVKQNLGRVVLFRNFLAKKETDLQPGDRDMIDILDVDGVGNDFIRAGSYVLPTGDATVVNSDEGLVYVYNVSLPYLSEIQHLAQVEKNIVIGQAYLYQGRNVPNGKVPTILWFVIALIFVMGIVAIIR